MADDPPAPEGPPCDTCQPVIQADTIVYIPPPEPTGAGSVSNPVNLEDRLYQNPTKALFKSLLVPGWGQVGNRRYVKAGVIFALEVLFVGAAIHYDNQVGDARRMFESAESLASRNNWYDYMDNKRKNRGKFAWYAGITIFISMFDAYVDAHLFGFADERAQRGRGAGGCERRCPARRRRPERPVSV